MKNLMKLGMALLIAAMVLGFGGCFEPEETPDDAKKSATSHIDFGSYSGVDRSLSFFNKSSKPVILFKGELDESKIIGGVPANVLSGNGHGIYKDPNFFSQTEAFKVIALSEDQYVNNKGNLSGIQYPFTTLYAFYNQFGENINIYEISGLLEAGEYYIEITVPQTGTWNVELRNGGTNGPALGYAAAGMFSTRLYVQPNTEFYLFPAFHRWNSFRDVLETVFPRDDEGAAILVATALDATRKYITIPMGEYIKKLDLSNPNVGAAYVVVNNGVTGSDIQLWDNSGPIRNSFGVSLLKGGQTVFQFNMADILGSSGNASGNFAESYNFSGYRAGTPSSPRNITAKRESTDTSSSILLKNGFIYNLEVNGSNMSPTSVTAEIDLTEDGVKAITFNANDYQ